MILIITGAPGAGKGTIAEIIQDELGFSHASTGDMLRSHVKEGDEIGIEVKSIIDSGKLVSDELIEKMIYHHLTKMSKNQTDCLLDGFPRTLNQAKDLVKFTNIKGVVQVVLEDELIIERLSHRLVCNKCGASFHSKTNPSKKEGVCDFCGEKLVQREDDKPEIIKSRLETYHKETEPIFNFYKKNNISIIQLRGDLDINVQKDFIIGKVKKLLE